MVSRDIVSLRSVRFEKYPKVYIRIGKVINTAIGAMRLSVFILLSIISPYETITDIDFSAVMVIALTG